MTTNTDRAKAAAEAALHADALADLFSLFTRNTAGQWCFNSLNRDASAFDDAMDRLAAATSQVSTRDGKGDTTLVEIIGPDGKIHYRRPWNDPDVQEAFNTLGYSVRKAQGTAGVAKGCPEPKRFFSGNARRSRPR